MSLNKIQKIKTKNFEGAKLTANLMLNENKIESIERDSFQYLRKLENLNLSTNKLVALKDYTFKNDLNLKCLDLSSNSLSQITKGLASLVALKVERNYLTDLNQNIFGEMRALKSLYLGFNKIGAISTEIFHCNQDNKIESFFLNDNKIVSLDFLANKSCYSNLKLQDVSNYLIKSIKLNTFNLVSLEVVDFSENKIADFGMDSFKYSHLRTINVSRSVQNATLFDLANSLPDFITELDLSYNKFSFFKENSGIKLFDSLKKLVIIDNLELFNQ